MMIDDLATHLANLGFGVVDQTIQRMGLIESPDAQIGLLPSGGLSPEHTIDASQPHDMATVQLSFRSGRHNPGGAFAQSEDVYNQLDALFEMTVGGTTFVRIQPLQPPFLLLQDEADRHIFVFNALVESRRP